MEKLFIFVGKAATGKDTALNYFIGDQYNILVSDTTRPKRTSEVNGKDYNFIDNRTFLQRLKKGEYLEHTKYTVGHEVWYYGTGKHAIKSDKINLGVLNPEGVFQVCCTDYRRKVFVVLFKVSDEVRKTRYMERELQNQSKDVIALEKRFDKRSLKDDDDFFELEKKLIEKNIRYSVVYNDSSAENLIKITEKIVIEEYKKI